VGSWRESTGWKRCPKPGTYRDRARHSVSASSAASGSATPASCRRQQPAFVNPTGNANAHAAVSFFETEFDTGVMPGQSYAHTFNTPGQFFY
jgi:hypothetical protein